MRPRSHFRIPLYLLAVPLVLLTVVLVGCGDDEEDQPAATTSPTPSSQASPTPRLSGELTVFAAASLTDAFTEIKEQLEAANPGFDIVYNFAGSQALRTQLEQGADADVFASADAPQMEQAKQSRVVENESPIFIRNRLAVIVPKDNPAGIDEFRDIANDSVKLDLAAANVPVGNYSRQAFQKASADYGAELERNALRNVVSEEENVKQVVTKVQLGEADAGIVYVSDVTPSVGEDVSVIDIPDAYNQIAEYPIALTKDAGNRSAATAFVAYVLSTQGQNVLKSHNFIPIAP